jgi:hypothetical protein
VIILDSAVQCAEEEQSSSRAGHNARTTDVPEL